MERLLVKGTVYKNIYFQKKKKKKKKRKKKNIYFHECLLYMYVCMNVPSCV